MGDCSHRLMWSISYWRKPFCLGGPMFQMARSSILRSTTADVIVKHLQRIFSMHGLPELITVLQTIVHNSSRRPFPISLRLMEFSIERSHCTGPKPMQRWNVLTSLWKRLSARLILSTPIPMPFPFPIECNPTSTLIFVITMPYNVTKLIDLSETYLILIVLDC